MKRLIVAFCLTLFASQGWGAIVFVKPDPSTMGGDPKVNGTSGCTIIMAAYNTWPDHHVEWSGVGSIISGVSDIEQALQSAGANGSVYIWGTTSGVTYTTTALDEADGIDFTASGQYLGGEENVTLLMASATNDDLLSDLRSGTTVENLTLINKASTKYGANLASSTSVTYRRVTFRDSARSVRTGIKYTTLEYCLFTGISSPLVAGIYSYGGDVIVKYCEIRDCNRGLTADNNAGVTVWNTLIHNSLQEAVLLDSNGTGTTIELINSQILSGASSLAAKHTIRNLGATYLKVRNSLIHYHPDQPETYFLSGVTDSGGNQYGIPRFVHGRYPGIICLGIDDSENSSQIQAVATLAETYGYKVFWSISTDAMSGASWTIAQNLVSRGHEIVSHAVDHLNLPTCDPACDGLTAAQQVANSKTAIEANIPGYTCNVFMPPFNATSAGLQTSIKTAGYIGARGNHSSGGGTALLQEIKPFNLAYFDLAYLNVPLQRNLAGLLTWLTESGGIATVYTHGFSEFSLDEWDQFFKLIATSHVTVMTPTEALEHINNARTGFLPTGVDILGDGTVFQRTLVDQSDYRLQEGSPCIDAGIAVEGVTQDFRGRPIPKNGTPDIGPYESWTIPHPRMGRQINHATQYHLDRGREGRKKERYLP